MKENTLYIPQGIKLRREYFDGFGNKELKYLTISIVLTGIFSFIAYHTFLGLFQSMLIFMVVPTAVAFLTVQTDMNISVLDEIFLLTRYQKSQKVYPYVALKEWGKI